MNIFRCYHVFSLIPIALVATTVVADPAPTTLDGYLQRALTANPELNAMSSRQDAAVARVTQAGALPDPTLQVTHFVESVQTRTGPQENTFMLNQRIPWPGRLRARQDAAAATAEGTAHLTDSLRNTIARQTGTVFFDYAYLGKALDLTRENLALLEHLSPQLEERVRTGGDLNQLLRLKVETGRLRDRLATLEQQRPQLQARLAALLDMSGQEFPWPEWPDADANAPTDSTSLLAAIDAGSPDLLALQAQRDSARALVELARLETRPDLTLGINYIQTGNPAMATPGAGRDPWALMVAVNLPVWGSRTSAVREESRATRQAADRAWAARRNQLHAEAIAATASLADARRRCALYQNELIPLARQAVTNTTDAYQTGRASLLELIDTQRTLLDLELQLWRAKADVGQQTIIINTLANRPL